MKAFVLTVLSFVLLIGCAHGQQPPVKQDPQEQPAQNGPAKVGDDVPNTNGQMKYEEVQPLSNLEKSAVEGFNAKAAVLQNQMNMLQTQGKELISELKDNHKVKGSWLVSPDGASLVMVKQKTPGAPPVGAPTPKADKPAAPAPSAKPKQKSEVKHKATGNVSQTSTGPNSPNINGADNITVKPPQ